MTNQYHPWVVFADASAVSIGFGLVQLTRPSLATVSLLLSIVWVLFRFACDPVVQKLFTSLWKKISHRHHKRHRKH